MTSHEDPRRLVASLLEADRLDECSALLEGILSGEPGDVHALHSLGVVRSRQGEHQQAVNLIGRALAIRPSSPALYVNLAEVYRSLGQPDLSANSCRIALGLNPRSPGAYHTLGLAMNDLGRLDEAAEHLRRAIELDPAAATVHNNLGMVLSALGRREEAIGHFRRAIELDTDLQRGRTNLGLALLDERRADEALVHFQEALRREPDSAVHHHNLGTALRALDRDVEARGSFLNALYLDPGLPHAHMQIGASLRQEGDLDNAIQWYKSAENLSPDNPTILRQLAELHRETEEGAIAIGYWERFIALSPENEPVARLGIASALQDEGRAEEALGHFQAAASMTPKAAAPLLGMASVHEELGRMAEAEAALRAALLKQPGTALAHARLATLLRIDLPDADLEALIDKLADPALDAFHRGRLLYGLAHVLDARGDYAKAADCIREASALTLKDTKPAMLYKADDHVRFIDNTILTFNDGFFGSSAGMGPATREPIFVFGLPRSGTTLIEQILASHPRVHGAGELRLARHSFDSLPSKLGRPGPPMACIPYSTRETIQLIAEEHLEKLRSIGGAADRIVDKMPDNYMHLGFLTTLFPEATYIHCRRDLRDVAVSCRMTDFRRIRWSCDPLTLASRFAQYLRLMDHWRSVLPVRLVEVNYEETVADTEGVARRLLDACGLEWDPACLEFHRTARSVRTASVTQVRKPVYTRSVARWRNYEREMADVFDRLPIEGTAELVGADVAGTYPDGPNVIDG